LDIPKKRDIQEEDKGISGLVSGTLAFTKSSMELFRRSINNKTSVSLRQ
jgi:hypothetical protein